MKIALYSCGIVGEGTAPDDAPTMDPDFALMALGVVSYEVLPDATVGRSIDPTYVTADERWLVGKRISPAAVKWMRGYEGHWRESGIEEYAGERWRRDADALTEWVAAIGPCEALASRDPGRTS